MPTALQLDSVLGDREQQACAVIGGRGNGATRHEAPVGVLGIDFDEHVARMVRYLATVAPEVGL